MCHMLAWACMACGTRRWGYLCETAFALRVRHQGSHCGVCHFLGMHGVRHHTTTCALASLAQRINNMTAMICASRLRGLVLRGCRRSCADKFSWGTGLAEAPSQPAIEKNTASGHTLSCMSTPCLSSSASPLPDMAEAYCRVATIASLPSCGLYDSQTFKVLGDDTHEGVVSEVGSRRRARANGSGRPRLSQFRGRRARILVE